MHHNTDGIGVEIEGCAVSAVISMEQVRFEIGRRRFTENVDFTADSAVKVSERVRITNG